MKNSPHHDTLCSYEDVYDVKRPRHFFALVELALAEAAYGSPKLLDDLVSLYVRLCDHREEFDIVDRQMYLHAYLNIDELKNHVDPAFLNGKSP